MDTERYLGCSVNEYVLLCCGEKQTIPARLQFDKKFVRLNIPDVLKIPDGQSLKPLNLGQRCLIDALLNPDISLVTCYGHAGTGKDPRWRSPPVSTRCSTGNTTVSPSADRSFRWAISSDSSPALSMKKCAHGCSQSMMRLICSCVPNVPLGPKRKQPKPGDDSAVKKPYEALMEQGILEIEALCYIRGRSIPNRFLHPRRSTATYSSGSENHRHSNVP